MVNQFLATVLSFFFTFIPVKNKKKTFVKSADWPIIVGLVNVNFVLIDLVTLRSEKKQSRVLLCRYLIDKVT